MGFFDDLWNDIENVAEESWEWVEGAAKEVGNSLQSAGEAVATGFMEGADIISESAVWTFEESTEFFGEVGETIAEDLSDFAVDVYDESVSFLQDTWEKLVNLVAGDLPELGEPVVEEIPVPPGNELLMSMVFGPAVTLADTLGVTVAFGFQGGLGFSFTGGERAAAGIYVDHEGRIGFYADRLNAKALPLPKNAAIAEVDLHVIVGGRDQFGRKAVFIPMPTSLAKKVIGFQTLIPELELVFSTGLVPMGVRLNTKIPMLRKLLTAGLPLLIPRTVSSINAALETVQGGRAAGDANGQAGGPVDPSVMKRIQTSALARRSIAALGGHPIVCLRTQDGRYLVDDGHGGLKVSDAATPTGPEKALRFEMQRLGRNTVALRRADGRYVRTGLLGAGRVAAAFDRRGHFDTFRLIGAGPYYVIASDAPLARDGFRHQSLEDPDRPAHSEAFIDYLNPAGEHWRAGIRGNTFLHAPNGRWKDGHTDDHMNYLAADGRACTVFLDGDRFRIRPLDGAGAEVRRTWIDYEDWNGSKWRADLCRVDWLTLNNDGVVVTHRIENMEQATRFYLDVINYPEVYEHLNCEGRARPLLPGPVDMDQLDPVPNDAISSVRLPPGWRVTFFPHANWEGDRCTVASSVGNAADFRINLPAFFQDQVSSVMSQGPGSLAPKESANRIWSLDERTGATIRFLDHEGKRMVAMTGSTSSPPVAQQGEQPSDPEAVEPGPLHFNVWPADRPEEAQARTAIAYQDWQGKRWTATIHEDHIQHTSEEGSSHASREIHYRGWGATSTEEEGVIRYIGWDGRRAVAIVQPEGFLHTSQKDGTSHFDVVINYLNATGEHWQATFSGDTFTHAPEGDYRRAHTDTVINYLTPDGQSHWARLLDDGFEIWAENDPGARRRSQVLVYRAWDGTGWTATLQRNFRILSESEGEFLDHGFIHTSLRNENRRHYDTIINYLEPGTGQRWQASFRGRTFRVLPEGDPSRARESDHIHYVGADDLGYRAYLQEDSLKIKPDDPNLQAFESREIEYKTWDGSLWEARFVLPGLHAGWAQATKVLATLSGGPHSTTSSTLSLTDRERKITIQPHGRKLLVAGGDSRSEETFVVYRAWDDAGADFLRTLKIDYVAPPRRFFERPAGETAPSPRRLEVAPDVPGRTNPWDHAVKTYTLDYVTWDGSRWEAAVVDGAFLHAPEGDWSRAHADTYMNYRCGDTHWRAYLTDNGFFHAPEGNRDAPDAHPDDYISFVGHDGRAWRARFMTSRS